MLAIEAHFSQTNEAFSCASEKLTVIGQSKAQ